jgi:hypothetical protein
MSLKLSNLKKWLTLEDSAKYLSLLISEEVTVTDLLQLTLQQDLTLSINLVNSYPAQLGPKVPIQEATMYKVPLLEELISGKAIEEVVGKTKHVILEALTGTMLKNLRSTSDTTVEDEKLMSQVAWKDTGKSKADYSVYFKGDALPDYSGVLEFDRNTIQHITGVWDLPMVGSESLVIEELFYGKINGPSVDWVRLSGVILKHPSINKWANLYERYQDQKDGLDPSDFCPRGDLPSREPLVIRRDELQRFANSLNEAQENIGTDSEKQEYPPNLDALILAWRKFWKNADRTDRTACPKKEDVKAWLIDQGLSAKCADAGATTIKPQWAGDKGW